METSASGKTPRLGLSQWAAEDYIRREDFNSDFAAIDDAIANSGGVVKLKEFTLSESVSQVDIDVTDINWSQYHYVYLDIDPNKNVPDSQEAGKLYYLRINNITDNSKHSVARRTSTFSAT